MSPRGQGGPATPGSNAASLADYAAQGHKALRTGRPLQAEQQGRSILDRQEDNPDGWILLARARQQLADFDRMADYAERARAVAPERIDAALLCVEALIATGQIEQALDQMAKVAERPDLRKADQQQLAMLYMQLNRHRRAYACAVRGLDEARPDVQGRFTVASAAIALGRFAEAEQQLQSIIDTHPDQAEAFYTRSTLRRQTPASNHVQELRARLSGLNAGDAAEIPLRFALGKELEDLGDYDEAFACFDRGNKARCARLSYDVRADTQAMEAIQETFSSDWRDSVASGYATQVPIFVLGMPRSGTTLVERILASHDEVASLGEINDFAYAVMRHGSPAGDKHTLIRNVAAANMHEIGREYCRAQCGYGEQAPRLIDKTPGNFLYLGLIASALPNARIVHVHRHPVAGCYAMYKALFRMGYPFSYDLEMLAAYWLAYDRLMRHWHTLFGERILDVSYEQLIDDQESESRRIVEHCGLRWSDACLRFHENEAPSGTASAVQVRQPLYRTARNLWQQYEQQLAPLRTALLAGGARI